jgi:lactoylglutathione lyase
MTQKLLIYSDGGARGNPGPAAIAFIAISESGATLKADSRYIGVRTNNQAEYEALLLALKYAVDSDAKVIVCHLDSELVAKQLTGEYAVRNSELQQLYRQVKNTLGCFKKVTFVNVPRSHPQISRADALVNKTLDEEVKKPERPNSKAASPLPETMDEGTLFVHASIRTSNMQRSVEFYSKFLGLQVKGRHNVKATDAEIVFLQDSTGKGCTLELTCYRNQKEFQQPEYEKRLFDHLGFEVADIHKTLAAMKKNGVTITDEPSKFSEHTTIAFVEDPDGTLIELVEHKHPIRRILV